MKTFKILMGLMICLFAINVFASDITLTAHIANNYKRDRFHIFSVNFENGICQQGDYLVPGANIECMSQVSTNSSDFLGMEIIQKSTGKFADLHFNYPAGSQTPDCQGLSITIPTNDIQYSKITYTINKCIVYIDISPAG